MGTPGVSYERFDGKPIVRVNGPDTEHYFIFRERDFPANAPGAWPITPNRLGDEMMSKRRVPPPKTATAKAVAPIAPDELAQFLHAIEDRCNHAADILNAAARAVAGNELTLHDDDMPTVFAVALEHAAGQLEALSDRALHARVANLR